MCSAQSMPIACQTYKLRRLCDMTQPKTQEDQASAFQLQLMRLPLDKDTLDLVGSSGVVLDFILLRKVNQMPI